jgi:anti-anti-sigma regulatory factor
MVLKIKVNQELGKYLSTRNTIKEFFEKIESTKLESVVMDFKEVDFISRSCADEYLKQKDASQINITEVNLSKNVKNMFRATLNPFKINKTVTKSEQAMILA